MGDLRFGILREQVHTLLGQPDATGNTSRKYPWPSIYLYGTVELWFARPPLRGLSGVYWEAGDKGAFRLTKTCVVDDWDLSPRMQFEEVEDCLGRWGFAHKYWEAWPGERPPILILPSGVKIDFDEERRLYSVCASTDRVKVELLDRWPT